MTYDIVIVGGGISGLYILDQFTSKFGNLKIKLREELSSWWSYFHNYYQNGDTYMKPVLGDFIIAMRD